MAPPVPELAPPTLEELPPCPASMSLPIEANRLLHAGVAIINPKPMAESARKVFMLNLHSARPQSRRIFSSS
jgi:hypothetical protein